jgi:uncharacterized protein
MRFRLIRPKGRPMILKRIYSTIIALLIPVLLCNVHSQNIPEKPVPPRLVNDLAGILNPAESNRLEQRLVSFNDSTSTQISIVTVPSLDGYAPSDYAQRLGEKWGIGRKKLDNGVLILVKPKTPDSRGEIFIATGYGLEGVIPDITAAEIVDYEILPSFRNGDYYGGLVNAVNTLMDLARGEYTASEYSRRAGGESNEKSPGLFGIIFIIIILLIIFRKRGSSGNRKITGSGLPFWLLMGMLGSGNRSHRGSWGGFSGGGGFGRGGGGFGGFGGGSFGGGGAGGSW